MSNYNSVKRLNELIEKSQNRFEEKLQKITDSLINKLDELNEVPNVLLFMNDRHYDQLENITAIASSLIALMDD